MATVVSLELFKKHVNADDFTSDDEYLQHLLDKFKACAVDPCFLIIVKCHDIFSRPAAQVHCDIFTAGYGKLAARHETATRFGRGGKPLGKHIVQNLHQEINHKQKRDAKKSRQKGAYLLFQDISD